MIDARAAALGLSRPEYVVRTAIDAPPEVESFEDRLTAVEDRLAALDRRNGG